MSISVSNLSEAQLTAICKYGSYYFPASRHYDSRKAAAGPGAGQNETVVNCDRCGQSNLDAYIGLNDWDLCIGCVQILLSHLKQRRPASHIRYEEPPIAAVRPIAREPFYDPRIPLAPPTPLQPMIPMREGPSRPPSYAIPYHCSVNSRNQQTLGTMPAPEVLIPDCEEHPVLIVPQMKMR